MITKEKHLIIISFDALASKDYDILKQLPNFHSLLHNGSYVKKVYSVYPSLTYPAHTTIITGKYPINHGVINNTLLQPGSTSPDWYWYRKQIKADTLYDKAKEKGLSTAALLWPVTGKASIDYNLPEIFPNRWWQNQVMVSLYNGSPLYQICLNNKFGRLRNGLNQPELDDFVLASSVYTIKTKKPNLMLIHFTDVDTQRHKYGFYSKEAISALNRHDNRLGMIINALKEVGIYENSTIIALGDHSSLDEDKVINLNVLLKDNNLINCDNNGNIISWKAYLKTCDGSAYIYVNKEEKDIALIILELEKLLKDFIAVPSNGIEAMYSSAEAVKLGADSNCTFMLEAKKGYYFLENINGSLICDISSISASNEKHITKATHGYSPYKDDYTTVFIASGYGIKKNIILDSINLVDEAPTFAKLLELNLNNVDGQVIDEILL